MPARKLGPVGGRGSHALRSVLRIGVGHRPQCDWPALDARNMAWILRAGSEVQTKQTAFARYCRFVLEAFLLCYQCVVTDTPDPAEPV